MFRLAIGAVATALALTACSGASSSSNAAKSTVTTTTAAATSTTAPTTTTTDPGGGISDLALKAATADVKITYTSALGPSATLAQDGQGKSSFLSGGNLLLSDGTRVVRCNGTTAAATCTDLGPTSSDDALTQLISAYAGLSTLKPSNLGQTSAETIGGRPASCVTFKATDYASALGALADSNKITAAATVTVCVDDASGFAVRIALTDKGQSVDEILATRIGPSSPGDFVPPSPPVTLPATTTVPAG